MDRQTQLYGNIADKMGLLFHDSLLVVSHQPFVLEAFKDNIPNEKNLDSTQNTSDFAFTKFYDKVFIDASDLALDTILQFIPAVHEWTLDCIYINSATGRQHDLEKKFDELQEHYNWKYVSVMRGESANHILILK